MVDEGQVSRQVPVNALDFNMQVIKPNWGKKGAIPESLRERLKEYYKSQDPDTKEVSIAFNDLWGLLGSYTEDLRLGNLDNKVDIPYCEHYLNLAQDLLKEELFKPFIIALTRVATRIELSQSKNGFLRRRPNAIETKQSSTMNDSKKSGFFK